MDERRNDNFIRFQTRDLSATRPLSSDKVNDTSMSGYLNYGERKAFGSGMGLMHVPGFLVNCLLASIITNNIIFDIFFSLAPLIRHNLAERIYVRH